MEWAEAGMPKRRGKWATSRYPWRFIAESGKVARLNQGDDYDNPEAARQSAYAWAKHHGYRIETRLHDDDGALYVRFSRAS